MEKMMALRAYLRGRPESLVYESTAKPEPEAGEVLVEVHATAITFTELTWNDPFPPEDGSGRDALIPGHEVSGVVVDLGDGVTAFAVGDQVYGRIGFDRDGAAAEFVSTPATDLALRPTSIDHVTSAALPLAALTAWQALFDHADLRSEEHVLVLGGAGGVGAFAVQLAKRHGARVSATASGSDLRFVSELGADVVLDYRSLDPSKAFVRADVVIDAVGGPATVEALDMVRPGGRFVTLSEPVAPDILDGRDVSATFFIVDADADELAQIAAAVDRGELLVTVAQVFPLADGKAAFERGPNLHRPGKTVLEVVPR